MENILDKEPVKRVQKKLEEFSKELKAIVLNSSARTAQQAAESLNTEFLSSEKKLLVSAKLQNWIEIQIKTHLKPIKEKLEDNIDPNIRAITFNCFENLGTLEIDNFRDFIKKIDDKSKHHLSKLGIRIGAKFFFIPHLMKKNQLS